MSKAQDLPTPAGETQSTILVPPRPNLGPEPLTEPSGGISIVLFYLAFLALLAALGVWRYVQWQRKFRPESQGPREHAEGSSNDAESLPGVRLLALADRARTLLIERFGDAWRAKTTEEIAGDPRFSAMFDAGEAAMFLDLLRRSDVEKFSQHRDAGDQGDLISLLDTWESLLRDRLEAGARSTINGK